MDWEVLLRGANLYRKAEPERERADCESAASEHGLNYRSFAPVALRLRRPSL